jgi:hypothetical protein
MHECSTDVLLKIVVWVDEPESSLLAWEQKKNAM